MRINGQEVERCYYPVRETNKAEAEGLSFYHVKDEPDYPPQKGQWFYDTIVGQIKKSAIYFQSKFPILIAVRDYYLPQLRRKFVSKKKKRYQKLLEQVQSLEAWKRRVTKVYKRHKKHNVTVLVFFESGKESAYHFMATEQNPIDYERIKRELIEDEGFAAVIIKDGDCVCRGIKLPVITFSFNRICLKERITEIREMIAIANNKEKVNA
jgi:hypothetical protein